MNQEYAAQVIADFIGRSKRVHMRQEYTAKEIADLMGVSGRYIQRKAAKESWPFQTEKVRGGRLRKYPLKTLPAYVFMAIILKRNSDEEGIYN